MVFGLFSKEKSLQKTIERATNKLAQQPDRWGALEKLRDDGSEEALLGLCKRFAVTSTKGVEDEQEKTWVVDVLVGKGKEALSPVRRYMKGAEGLAFPLKVLERIADKATALEIFDELLAGEPPGYARFPDRRIDLLRWFAEWKPATADEVLARVAPYLADFDENVRFAAIDGLSHHDPGLLAGPLVAALVRPEEESGRIRRTIIEVLEQKHVPLGDHAAAVATALTGPLASYRVDGDQVKRA
jgi:hypothetical protein